MLLKMITISLPFFPLSSENEQKLLMSQSWITKCVTLEKKSMLTGKKIILFLGAPIIFSPIVEYYISIIYSFSFILAFT